MHQIRFYNKPLLVILDSGDTWYTLRQSGGVAEPLHSTRPTG